MRQSTDASRVAAAVSEARGQISGLSAQAVVSHEPGPVSSYLSCLYLYKATLARRRETRPQNRLVRADLKKLRPRTSEIELRPANDLEARVQPVEVPGDDDYTLS